MKGFGRRIAHTTTTTTTTNLSKHALYSTFSGGGRGRGGGGSGGPSPSNFSPGKPIENDPPNDAPPPSFPPGVGHGSGKPIASNPIPTSFSSPWMSNADGVHGRGRGGSGGVNPSIGRGQGQGQTTTQPLEESQSGQSKKPIFFRRGDMQEQQLPQFSSSTSRNEGVLPSSLGSGLPGAGRGKPLIFVKADERRVEEENRHMRRRPTSRPQEDGSSRSHHPRVDQEEAAKNAIGILSRESENGGRGRGGFRGRGGRGGRGFRGRGGRGRGGGGESDDDESGLKLGADADGERLAQRLGPERMAKLTEAFDEMSYRVLPCPMDDAYLDAQHTNNMIEYEPEYLVEFDNPDIDEKPPISLRDALEKMKPFLMAYEGIKSQEEWEEIIEELMGRVPYMKELIDIYCGPDRVTAKQQQEELARVAKTLPKNVPSTVKRFTDRAVLSLQSNPGWGWDKKCQFMDKLVWEVSQQYK